MIAILRRFLVASLVLPGVILAQGTINTYAGSDALFAGGGQAATSAQLVNPNNVAVDAQGNVYFSDGGLAMVLRVATNSIISVVAGNGLSSGGGDGGLAVGASLGYPAGLAFDSSGNLYIADTDASRVRKVDTNGIITTAGRRRWLRRLCGRRRTGDAILAAKPDWNRR
jgi:secreted PhoX family phosphatase